MIQPLPGVSYLATSSVYYDMMAQRMKTEKKRKGPIKQSRRTITESRITSNIMSYNQPVALVDNSIMEISADFLTQVSQSKYALNSQKYDSIFMQKPLPLEFLLNTDLTAISSQLLGKPSFRQEINSKSSRDSKRINANKR
jgi:hypothetical protein